VLLHSFLRVLTDGWLKARKGRTITGWSTAWPETEAKKGELRLLMPLAPIAISAIDDFRLRRVEGEPALR
jgi:hypothetical protein